MPWRVLVWQDILWNLVNIAKDSPSGEGIASHVLSRKGFCRNPREFVRTNFRVNSAGDFLGGFFWSSSFDSEGGEWGVGSVVVESAFSGRPDFQSRAAQNPYFEGFGGDLGQKSGAPQAQIQRPRIQRPILGPLIDKV